MSKKNTRKKLKKLNTLARTYLSAITKESDNSYTSEEKSRLLARYSHLPIETKKFILPDPIQLQGHYQTSEYGIEVLDTNFFMLLTPPLRTTESKFLELRFEYYASILDVYWRVSFYREDHVQTGKNISLRTTHPQVAWNVFELPSDAAYLKIEPNADNFLLFIDKFSLTAADNTYSSVSHIPKKTRKHRGVICFPIIDWEFRKQRPQHIARELASYGNHIMYLSTRMYGFHHNEVVSEDLEPRITKLTLPGNFRTNLYKDTPTPRSIDQACRALTKYLLERAFEDVVLICHLPFWYPFAKKLQEERGYPIIYDCMDDHSGFENNTLDMLSLEHTLCEKADALITTSQLLYESKKNVNKNCTLIRNAGDVRHFSQSNGQTPHSLKDLKKPIIGYFGAIAEWFDLDAIKTSLKSHPEWSHVLIGHYEPQTYETLKDYPNLKMLGEIEYAALPEYLYTFDVCTIPFKRIPLTEATNPVKIYEYFASGKPVVSRNLPEVEAFAHAAYLYNTPEEFVSCLETALKEGNNTEKQEIRKTIARNNTWEMRGFSFERVMNTLQKKVSIIIVSYEALSFLSACVESILHNTEYTNYEIVIVDNNSSKPVVEYLQNLELQVPHVKVLYNDYNAGFAKANNQGLAYAADSDYFVLLNNDTVVPSGWLHRLVYYAAKPDIGMVGPVTNNIGNEAQICINYADMEEMSRMSWGLRNQFQGEIFDIKILAMFCVAFRREVLEKVGYLDESFTTGMFEDDDYAQRIRAAGLRLVCAEDVFVHHYGSVSFKQLDKKAYQELFEKNKAIYESKWGKWIPHVYR